MSRPPMVRSRAYVAVFALALATSAIVGSHGLAYWDAGDYVREAIRGEPSGLLLGRPLFLAVSRAIVHACLRVHAPASALEPTLRWFWCVVSSFAPPLLAALSLRLGVRPRGALLAGVALALAPSFAHTAHQAMTDAPAVALSLAALVIAASGDSIPHGALAGVVLGAATATRETAIVHALAMLLLLRRSRAIVVALVALFAVLAIALAEGRGIGLAMIPGWIRAMRGSAAKHPLGAREVAISIGWMLAIGPAPLAAAWIGVRRDLGAMRDDREARRRLAVALPALIASLALVAYPDGAFSPRYFLAVIPALLVAAGPVLDALVARPRVATALAALSIAALVVGKLGARGADALARESLAMHARLATIPDGSLVLPGHLCPAFEAAEAARDATRTPGAIASRRYGIVCPGWGWPERRALFATLDDARCGGRAVVVDTRDEAWVGAREAQAREDVRAYVDREGAAPRDAGFVVMRARRCP